MLSAIYTGKTLILLGIKELSRKKPYLRHKEQPIDTIGKLRFTQYPADVLEETYNYESDVDPLDLVPIRQTKQWNPPTWRPSFL